MGARLEEMTKADQQSRADPAKRPSYSTGSVESIAAVSASRAFNGVHSASEMVLVARSEN
jgi:hypothetical protein